MHPILFHAGPVTVRSFGVMMALAFVAAGVVAWWQLKRRGENPELVFNLLIGAIVGGVVGAKLHYLILHPDQFRVAAFSGGGLVWYGGFFGGVAGIALAAWLSKLRFGVTADVAAPAVAMGYAVGRIGCFLNGDDYGRPTSLPWAMAFPKGEPPTTALVHPTQLYESLLSLGIFFLLIYVFAPRLRRSGQLFAVWLVLAGIERFLVEFVRTNVADLLGLTQQQWISVGLVLAGVALFWWLQRRPEDPALAASGVPVSSSGSGGQKAGARSTTRPEGKRSVGTTRTKRPGSSGAKRRKTEPKGS